MDPSHLTWHPMLSVDSTADQQICEPVSQAVTASELLSTALAYAAAGWPVFRIEPGGKAPATPNGFYAATTNPSRIRNMWAGGKPYNVAIVTGAPGPDVLDVDVKPDGNGWPAFNALKRAGLLAGAFRLVKTPSGGAHLYFAPTAQGCGSLKGLFIDFKARGGYVLVPPSQVAGRPYEVIDDRPFTGAKFDWQAARQLLCPPRPLAARGSFQHGPGSAAHLVQWLEGEAEGNRNHALFWAACCALEAGDEAVVGELAEVAISAGLTADEVHKTIGSAYKKVAGNGG